MHVNIRTQTCLHALAPLSLYGMIHPPQETQWKFPSQPLRVTPSVCACLSANASSFLKLGPPVGLRTPLTAHSYASLLPNGVSAGMREEPKVSLDYICGARRYQRKLVKVFGFFWVGRKLLDWFGGSEDLNGMGKKWGKHLSANSASRQGPWTAA